MLADRYGTRNVALAGVAFLAAALSVASRAQSVGVLYATYRIGLGIGVGLTYVPSVGAVQPWFEKRAFASGIAVSGIGAGNLVGPPLAAWWIEALRLARRLPRARAARWCWAARLRRRSANRGHRAPATRAWHCARRCARAFWVLFASLALSCFGCFVPMVHLAPYAVDAGHPGPRRAAGQPDRPGQPARALRHRQHRRPLRPHAFARGDVRRAWRSCCCCGGPRRRAGARALGGRLRHFLRRLRRHCFRRW